ncbi:DUF4115 domain-containing protein [Curvibacter sp. APW13]|uniref:helix-turn-helix domain-containing protein n=1 Tax=Curvibacter sp. APW13 TaxID=3077236 RepID=UPI0028DF13AF|nr:RodZ domain-containing protein [Curvibacter sp. APW13]MDT8991723.1 DUF4115 domain-containing protein [Curvibacter sp. APW13]
MSDALRENSEELGSVLHSPSPDTPGALLRAARERAGLHVAALAVAIKIPVKKLEALEADQLQATHDIVFVRALASSVCRALKIDSKPIMEALPQSAVKELHVDDNGINAPFASGSHSASLSPADMLKQPWALLVLALGAGAIAMLGMGWWEGREVPASPTQPVASEEPVSPPPLAPQVTAPMVIPSALEPAKAEPATPATSAAPVVVTAAAQSVPVLPSTAPVVKEGAASPAAVATATSAAPSGTERVMSFKAKQQSVWVEVVDARGDVRLRRNVAAGEKVECAGVLPLTVVLGRADAVEVEVRGKPFNFTPFVRENVARFEVK